MNALALIMVISGNAATDGSADTTLAAALQAAVSQALANKPEVHGKQLLIDVESFRNDMGRAEDWSAPKLSGRQNAAARTRLEVWGCPSFSDARVQCQAPELNQVFVYAVDRQVNVSGVTVLFNVEWSFTRPSTGRRMSESTTYRAEFVRSERDGWQLARVAATTPHGTTFDRLPPEMVDELRRRRQAGDSGGTGGG